MSVNCAEHPHVSGTDYFEYFNVGLPKLLRIHLCDVFTKIAHIFIVNTYSELFFISRTIIFQTIFVVSVILGDNLKTYN